MTENQAHTQQNGDMPPAALQRNPQQQMAALLGKQVGQPIADVLTRHLPGAMRGAVRVALQDVIACWPCFRRRAIWDARNPEVLQFAYLKACQAAGVEPNTPEAGGITFDQLVTQMPGPLRPDPADPFGDNGESLPTPFPPVLPVDGTWYCELDAKRKAISEAGPQQVQPGPGEPAPSLLVARGGTVHQAAHAAATATNLPGLPADARTR